MNCHYDAEAKDYLRPDGELCRNDDYGDPTHHCRARDHRPRGMRCNQHVGADEQTCARCMAGTRRDIKQVVQLSALMLPQAIDDGVNSGAAMLAGPAADYAIFSARRNLDKRWITEKLPPEKWTSALGLLEDDDERHPYSVLTRWQMMLSEDWSHDLPERMSIAGAGAYLERNLGRLANDPEQDWPLFVREVRKVRSHLESVLHNDTRPERGAPCPECRSVGKVVRMTRRYSHWCESEDCARFHFDDESADVWACPANAEHWFTAEAYANYLEDRGA